VFECVLQDGRVLYPIGYGADPTGEKDSSDAILQALGDAFQLRTGLELLSGIRDFGGVEIDLQGGSYKISRPLRFPSSGGGNILVTLFLFLFLIINTNTLFFCYVQENSFRTYFYFCYVYFCYLVKLFFFFFFCSCTIFFKKINIKIS
jgi:hypothetical protein